jgi:glycosyltransferase involved in cell wall biosynthesis
MSKGHRPLALLDARIGRNPTGIGLYTLNLAQALAEIAADEVIPVVRRVHRRRFAALGYKAWTFPPRTDDPRLLPDAAVVHGPNFHAPRHPTAERVATFHDSGFLRLPECHPPGMPDRLDALIRDSVTRTAVYICVSNSAKADLVEFYGVDEPRCRVVYHGVDARYVTVGSAPPRPLPRWLRVPSPYLLHVGAIIPRKDLGTLVEVFSLVRRTHPELHLVLAGNKTRRWASDWPRLTHWMRANPRDARHIRVLNYVNEKYLPDLYRNAVASISTTRWEGFGITVLEGLASGRPVVTSRVGSIPEIAGELVYYGEPGRPWTYAEAVLAALGGHDDARAARGRAHSASFTWARAAEQTLAIYRLAADELALNELQRFGIQALRG